MPSWGPACSDSFVPVAGMGIGTEAMISLQFQRLDRGTEVTVNAG